MHPCPPSPVRGPQAAVVAPPGERSGPVLDEEEPQLVGGPHRGCPKPAGQGPPAHAPVRF